MIYIILRLLRRGREREGGIGRGEVRKEELALNTTSTTHNIIFDQRQIDQTDSRCPSIPAQQPLARDAAGVACDLGAILEAVSVPMPVSIQNAASGAPEAERSAALCRGVYG